MVINMTDSLIFTCAELRDLAESNPTEMEIIVEMMIEAEAELCLEAS